MWGMHCSSGVLLESSQGGYGHAGKTGESYTNNFSVAFTGIPTVVAVHNGSAQTINVVVDAIYSSSFSARSTYASDTAAIRYIAAGK